MLSRRRLREQRAEPRHNHRGMTRDSLVVDSLSA